MIYGYGRVSSIGQNLEAQLKQLKDYPCDVIFQEKVSGRKKENRTEFNRLLETVTEGDVIVVTKLDRFARSTRDALNTIERLNELGVGLVVLNMGGDKVDTTTAIGKLMVTVLSGIAEFEADMNRERQREGIENAKLRGVYQGRPVTYGEKSVKLRHALDLARNRDKNGMTMPEISQITGVSRATIYNKLKESELMQ